MAELRRHIVDLAGGRQLDVVEAGSAGAPAIIVHNGTPSGAGLFVEHAEDALSRGLRLVSYSRPGYGRSTRVRGRDVASAAEDTAKLADALGIGRFATWGISGGGPHVLACAALLGDRVVAAASLASVAPYDAEGLDFLSGMGQENLDEFGAAVEGEADLTGYLETQAAALADVDPEMFAEQMRSLLSPPDRAVFSGSFGRQLAALMQDGIRDGIEGWADDDLAFTKPWGFSPSDIRVPLQIWQGPHDLMVPYTHGEWLVDCVPQAEAHLSPDDGHLTLYVRRVPDVHAWLASHF